MNRAWWRGFAGISGVESGKAAPLVGGPPGVELHTVVEGLPSGDAGDMVPVVLPTIGVGMVPNGDPLASSLSMTCVLSAVDGVGTDGAAMEGGGRAARAAAAPDAGAVIIGHECRSWL